jgi:hypothetical protein
MHAEITGSETGLSRSFKWRGRAEQRSHRLLGANLGQKAGFPGFRGLPAARLPRLWALVFRGEST